MSDTVYTQIELPRDIYELLRQRGERYGITPTQQIVEMLTGYLKGGIDPILQVDDPILRAVPTMDSGLGDLSTEHDRYLYRKDWQERAQARVSE
jgi:hypothetical protein